MNKKRKERGRKRQDCETRVSLNAHRAVKAKEQQQAGRKKLLSRGTDRALRCAAALGESCWLRIQADKALFEVKAKVYAGPTGRDNWIYCIEGISTMLGGSKER